MSNYQASIIFKEDLSSGGHKIPVGIHANCTLESVEKGETFYDINFKDSEGHTHNKRLWQPKGAFPRKDKDGNIIETPQDALAREERENMRHFIKLLYIFLGEDGLATVSGNSYNEFMEKAAALLNQKANTKKLNLKLIYDSTGVYSEFPKTLGFGSDYMEEYVEGQEPTLTFSKWELENRVEQKATATVSRKKDELDILLG